MIIQSSLIGGRYRQGSSDFTPMRILSSRPCLQIFQTQSSITSLIGFYIMSLLLRTHQV